MTLKTKIDTDNSQCIVWLAQCNTIININISTWSVSERNYEMKKEKKQPINCLFCFGTAECVVRAAVIRTLAH